MTTSFTLTLHEDAQHTMLAVATILRGCGLHNFTVTPMPKRTYWVIREKATGTLFPSAKGNTSFLEFDPALPPRMFTRRQDALTVVRHWVKGHTFQTRRQRNDEYDSFLMTTVPVEGRSIDKLEIIEITVGEVK